MHRLRIRHTGLVNALAILFVVSFSGLSFAVDIVKGHPRVIDGDTLEIDGAQIRLSGIDTPELGQTCTNSSGKKFSCGKQAAEIVSSLVAGRVVTCQERGRDGRERLLAECWTDKDGQTVNINEYLVSHGLAFAHTKYDESYLALEGIAKSHAMGLWAGKFRFPWDYRERQKPSKTQALGLIGKSPDADCPSARPYCKNVRSCSYACFLLRSCGFGGLDRDNDGIPCENVCRRRCP